MDTKKALLRIVAVSALALIAACDWQKYAAVEEEETGAATVAEQSGTFTDPRNGQVYRTQRIGARRSTSSTTPCTTTA